MRILHCSSSFGGKPLRQRQDALLSGNKAKILLEGKCSDMTLSKTRINEKLL
jgi:hypothetical protein